MEIFLKFSVDVENCSIHATSKHFCLSNPNREIKNSETVYHLSDIFVKLKNN